MPSRRHSIGDAVLAFQAVQHNPDLLFRRILLARRALDAPDEFTSGNLQCSACLVHLHALVVTICQKSSFIKSTQSVPLALMSDKHIKYGGVPVIAALTGVVVDGGLELASAAHPRVMDQ